MIPICLVTGFLGSGKTTLLKDTIRRFQNRRLVYLINEFSAVDVDGPLVEAAGGDAVSVPGGSIFCTCLVTEFIGTMTRIAEEMDTPENPVEGVVIEASGMANPLVVETMLEETGLNKQFELQRVLTVIEPRSFRRLIHTLPNIRSQVQAADLVVLNKCDLYSGEDLAATEAAALAIQPDADIVRARHGQITEELFPGSRPARGLQGEYAKCRDPLYQAYALHPPAEYGPDQLRDDLAAHEEDVYRLKGILISSGSPVAVDYSVAGFTSEPAAADSEPGLACIVRGEISPETEAWIQSLHPVD